MFDMRPTRSPLVRLAWPSSQDRLLDKSHVHRYWEGNWLSPSQSGLADTFGYHCDSYHHSPLHQQLQQHIMDDPDPNKRELGSGGESYSLHEYYADNFSMGGAGIESARGQTASQPVSLTNCGRDVFPSHHHRYTNKAVPGNEQEFFLDRPTANAYAHDMAGSFNQLQFQYTPYGSNDIGNTDFGIELQHRLPMPTEEYPKIPVFAEPVEFPHVSPATINHSSFSSSAGSTIASERMASMSLESGPYEGRTTAMGFRNSHHNHMPPTTIERPSWVASCPATISPKLLRINPSPTLTSSSESIHTGALATGSDPEIGVPIWELHEAYDDLSTMHPNHQIRKQLPTKSTKHRLVSSSSPSSRESAFSKGNKKAHVQQHNDQASLQCPAEPTHMEPLQAKPIPDDYLVSEADGSEEIVASSSTDVRRDAQNQFLVDSRLAGMTYRDIRRKGGFAEAESTLRGRFRTLTKNKEQRVRKPEWQDKDIRLLIKAVKKLAKGDRTSARVPWKQVATYIYENDGSYHFGNATCRKKWDELVEQGAAKLP